MDQASGLRDAVQRKTVETVPARLRCIAVGSGKGGVGKTMVAVSVACCLSTLGYRVLIFDADLGLANVDLQMGLDPKFTLEDVVFGNCSVADACVSVPGGPDVLAASSGSSEMVDIGGARRQMLVQELIAFAADYDFLIIDVGAGIGKGVTTFLSAAPQVAIVVANEPTSVMDAYSLIKVLSQQPDPPSLMLVVNMVQSIEEGETLAKRLNSIAKKFIRQEIALAGIVVYDPVVGDAIRARVPVVRYAEKAAPAVCVNDIARFLARGQQPGERTTRVTKRFFDQMAEAGTHVKGQA